MLVRTACLAGWLLILVVQVDAAEFGWLAALFGLSAVGTLLVPAGIPYLFFADAHRSGGGSTLWRQALGAILFQAPLFTLLITGALAVLLPSPVSSYVILLFVFNELLAASFVQSMALYIHAGGRASGGAALPAFLVIARLAAVIMFSLQSGADAGRLDYYLYLHVVSTSIAAFVSFFLTRRLLPQRHSPLGPSKPTLSASVRYMLMGGAGLATSELDKPVVARIMGLEAAGHYSVVYRVLAALSVPSTAIGASLLPRWTAAAARGDRRMLLGSFYVALTVALASGLVAGSSLVWFAGATVPGQWGIYEEAWAAVRYLWPLAAVLGMRQVAGAALIAMDRPSWRTGIELICFLLMAAGMHLGYRLQGFAGVAMACIIVEVIAVVMMVFVFHQSARSMVVSPVRVSQRAS